MADQPNGLANKKNLTDWAEYARSKSLDQEPIKAQSRRDLSPDSELPEHAWKKETGMGQGWHHWSDQAEGNWFTGKGGTTCGDDAAD